MTYEELMDDLESGDPSDETLEAAMDAMAFVQSLHNMFRDNGVGLEEEPDCSTLENLIDGVHGELAAACLFLSEKSFEQVPAMLRAISARFEKLDEAFKDDQGQTGPSVPVVIRKGFSRLADRIEATRVQQRQMAAVLKNSQR